MAYCIIERKTKRTQSGNAIIANRGEMRRNSIEKSTIRHFSICKPSWSSFRSGLSTRVSVSLSYSKAATLQAKEG